MKKIILCLIPLLIFQSCSWLEYFVITNQTNSDVVIEYELDNQAGGFGIFNNHPTNYKLNSGNDIDWNEQTEVADNDTSQSIVKLILKPKNALIFGSLSNDNYKKYNQYFINDRHFNLKKLNIKNRETVTEIFPENFDEHFTKKNGTIILRIK